MKGGHQEVPRTANPIPGEHAAGAIGTMRRRCETENENACLRIPEAGDGPCPVELFTIRGTLLLRDALAVLTQAVAALTRDDALMHCYESR